MKCRLPYSCSIREQTLTLSKEHEMTTSTDKYESLKAIGKSAMDSIAEMVAAAEMDWDRLEELRDDRDNFEPNTNPDGTPILDDNGEPLTWDDAFPDDAEELEELEETAGDCDDQEDAEQRVLEDPLSVEYRTDWKSAKEFLEPATPDEFCILLSTGGPATRIVGELDQGEPDRAWLEVQDWGTPWTQYFDADREVLLSYARRVASLC